MEKIYAPIDNKNIMEDCLEDEVFGNFYAASDHRHGKLRHLIGLKDNALVDVTWSQGYHIVTINVIAVAPTEDFGVVRQETYDSYYKVFKEWENDRLQVHFTYFAGELNVSFYFKID